MKSFDLRIFIYTFLAGFIICFLFDIYINPFLVNSGNDGAVYLQMGRAILDGKIPYTDLFDHKGVLLYVINAIGLLISANHWGIFLLASVNMSLCVFLWYKSSRLILSKRKSIFVIVLIALIYGFFSDRGNNPEEWALLYVSYCNYLFLRYLIKEINLRTIEIIVIGVCFGLLFFIKLSTAAPIVWGCLLWLYLCFKNNNFNKLFKDIVAISISSILSLLIVTIVYGIVYGWIAIPDLYFGTITFNLNYISARKFLLSIPIIVSLPIIIASVCLNGRKYKLVNIYAIGAFFSLCLAVGKNHLLHYFIVSIPLLLALISLIVKSEKFSIWYVTVNKYKYHYAIGTIALFCVSIYFIWPQFPAMINRGKIYENGYVSFKERYKVLSSEEKKQIWNYNAKFVGLNALNAIEAVQMNRIILPIHLQISANLNEKDDIKTIRPLRILVEDGGKWLNETDSAFISENYELEHVILMKNSSAADCIVYKRM